MIANVKEFKCTPIKNKIEELSLSNSCMTNYEIVSLMKSVVPEFISNNSVYEKLDKKAFIV